MCPSRKSYGLIQALQSALWKPIKLVEPGFIQGLDKEAQLDLFKKYVDSDWMSISMDGSAFDSSQLEPLQQCVDNQMWLRLENYLRRILENPINSSMRGKDIDVLMSQLMASLLDTRNVVFMHVPEVNGSPWPEEICREFKLSFGELEQEQPWVNYTYHVLHATTFSGLAHRTTFGNTMRSKLFDYFYSEEAGFMSPWLLGDRMFTIASGDDVAKFARADLTHQLNDAILANTSRSKTDTAPKGLGQCITETKISTFDDIDFCSKWFHSPTGRVEDLTYTRDAKKILLQKQYFVGQNQHILKDPYLHRAAILLGLRSEKVSHLLEDLLHYQMLRLKKAEYSEESLEVMD